MTKWHDNIPKSLLKEWDRKLAESGFKDIEAGVGRDGHMLKGATPSFRLNAATGQSKRTFDEVADSEAEIYNWLEGDRAEYYRLAERTCVRLADRVDPITLYCWCLHSQGCGERVIKEYLDIPRVEVARHLAPLKEEIRRLTTTPSVG